MTVWIENSAYKEIEHHTARLRVQRPLRRRVPRSADTRLQPGDKVLVCGELIVVNRNSERIGPYEVVTAGCSDKTVHFRELEEGLQRAFNLSKVRSFVSANRGFSITSTRCTEKVIKIFALEESTDVFVVAFLTPNDTRISTLGMKETKQAKVRVLLECGTIKFIPCEEIRSDGNVLPGSIRS